MARNLLKTLINCSEKAANIAKKCRADVNLLALLVEEKSGDEANPRFVQDFKTLADVLIQETIRHDVGKLFPELRDNIKGEESAKFTNKLGDSVSVVIGHNFEQTANCLHRVLDGNRIAAEVLANEVHKEVEYTKNKIPQLPEDLDYSTMGIWIDPIDATAEYIAGETIFSSFPGITSSGLDCVTVLIGVYDIESGNPIIGVINQPFLKRTDVVAYDSQISWGVNLPNFIANNIEKPKNKESKICVCSSSENPSVIEKVKSLHYEIAFSAGAGHKALKVITGEADLYILSKGSTYKWDTCGPQAILQSLMGGVFVYSKCLAENSAIPISYRINEDKCNTGGLIALKDLGNLTDIIEILSKE